jgi:hypothetical protein
MEGSRDGKRFCSGRSNKKMRAQPKKTKFEDKGMIWTTRVIAKATGTTYVRFTSKLSTALETDRFGSLGLRIKSNLLLALVGTLCLLTGCETAANTDYAIDHVNIVDPEAAIVRPDQTIVLHGNTISKVVASKDLKLPASLKVIDGSGKFVIPGLWDMHMHFRDAARDLKMDVANGVLGVRNMGGTINEVFGIRSKIAHGEQVGPKVVGCGPIVDGPNSWSDPRFTISVTTAAEARKTVNSLQKQGTDCIKVYDGLSRDSYFAIIEEAKRLGVPVVGHLPSAISVTEASNAGQRTLEHPERSEGC